MRRFQSFDRLNRIHNDENALVDSFEIIARPGVYGVNLLRKILRTNHIGLRHIAV